MKLWRDLKWPPFFFDILREKRWIFLFFILVFKMRWGLIKNSLLMLSGVVLWCIGVKTIFFFVKYKTLFLHTISDGFQVWLFRFYPSYLFIFNKFSDVSRTPLIVKRFDDKKKRRKWNLNYFSPGYLRPAKLISESRFTYDNYSF